MRGESLKCYCYNLKNIKNIGIYIAAIVLLKIVFLLFAFSKGELDSYLKIVIPAAVISMVIILYTCAMKSDYTFAVISILLLDIGTTMQVLISESPDRYILLQGIALVLGAILLIAVCMVQKHFSYKQQWLICLIGISVLYLILLIFGANINGTKAWIAIGGMSFQMTEIIKIISVVGMAAVFSSDTSEKKIIYSLMIVLVNVVFLVLIKEMGTLVVIAFIFLLYSFLFLENLKFFYFSIASIFTLGAGGILGTFFLSRLDIPNVTDFVLIEVAADIWGKLENRVVLLTAPDTLDPYGSAYQALTAQKAIHLGGLFGSSYQISIPVEESDYVFVSLILNMGLVLAILVLILFLCILLSGIRIYAKSANRLEGCTAAGFIYMIFFQSLLTMLGSTNAFLIMGLPMAFLSAGGSNQSMLFTMLFYILYVGRTICEKDKENGKEISIERRKAVCRIKE